MSESVGIYGLPRKLINFLRQMEKYRETLKWNINEGSHKLSLTMTWTMNKDRLSFVDRMKRTLRLNNTWTGEGIEVPKRSGSFRKKVQRSPERRCPFCNKTLPPDKGTSDSPWNSPWNLKRNSSLNKFSRGSSFNSPIRDANFNRSLSVRDSSFNRSSWSGPRSPTRTSTPKRDGMCNSVRSESPDQHSCTSSTKSVGLKLSYRTVEDIEISYEDLFQKAKEETTRQLDSIKKDWNKSIRISSRSQYSSSSSSSSIDDVINGDEVVHENGDANGIPSEPLAPAPPVVDQRPGTSAESFLSNHSNRMNNGLSLVQRATIERNNLRGPYKRLSYSTDIL